MASRLTSKVILAEAEGINFSEVPRELLAGYSENKEIGGYVDDLWKRIGAKFKKEGIEISNIDTIISEARQQDD